jgi:hypothetical protein
MTAVAWVLGLFGVMALLLAMSRLAAARNLAAGGHASLGVLLIGAAVAMDLLAADLASYRPRDGDRPIAELYFEQVGERRYSVTLTRLPEGRMQVFEFAGDAWRVDARTLDFSGWARAVGGRPGYRLDRLVAIDETAGDEAAPSISGGFALDASPRFDLWQSARESGRWGDLLVAGDARSDEHPMSGNRRLVLRLDGQRIDVRPAADDGDERVASETPGP